MATYEDYARLENLIDQREHGMNAAKKWCFRDYTRFFLFNAHDYFYCVSRGWLAHFDGTTVVQGLITVVGTGNTPFDLLVANTTYRDIFFDAPLEELWDDDSIPITGYENLLVSEEYTPENSYYASVSFQEEIGKPWHGTLTPQQVLKIRGQVLGAKSRGLRARYWDTPAWPVGRRDHVWDVLMREGVGPLNVDDLEAARERNWGG